MKSSFRILLVILVTMLFSCADITNAANDFGFKPITDIRAGLKEFVEWYKGYFGKS